MELENETALKKRCFYKHTNGFFSKLDCWRHKISCELRKASTHNSHLSRLSSRWGASVRISRKTIMIMLNKSFFEPAVFKQNYQKPLNNTNQTYCITCTVLYQFLWVMLGFYIKEVLRIFGDFALYIFKQAGFLAFRIFWAFLYLFIVENSSVWTIIFV